MIVSVNDGVRLLATTGAGRWASIDVLSVEGCPWKIVILEVMVASVEVPITISDNWRYPLSHFMQQWYFTGPQNDRNYSKCIPNVGA